ncbi:hypothetical protein PRK78_000524 [Emydomyces testavorans]|uniref:BHLH domain-containing protein n=1 Tax=Emydomyces testavorans TaxID=2070801 RepID=A0AAF0DAV8_9EURO|nr:hypothetical protein PRK78_000524 [Emydomyces testavorans]
MESPRPNIPRFTVESSKKQGNMGQRLQEMSHDHSLDPSAIREALVMSSPAYSGQASERENQLMSTDAYRDPYAQCRESHYVDASPPVSPMPGQYGNAAGSDNPDISPIDEAFEPAVQLPRKGNRLIKGVPVPHQPVKGLETTVKETETAHSTPRSRILLSRQGPAHVTKWDEFSGQPTNSDRGKFSQTPVQNPHLSGPSTTKFSPKHAFDFFTKSRGTSQRRKQANAPNSDDAALLGSVRPPWKGASGRSAILNPISTKKPSAEKPFFPPPRKDSQAPSAQLLHATSTSAGPSTRIDTFDFATSERNVREAGSYSGEQKSNNSYDQNRSLTLRKIPPGQSYTLRDEAQMQRIPLASDFSRLKDLTLDEQPVSRFSMTTYATAEGSRPTTSRQSDEKEAPPLPTIPNTAARTTKATSRKPTPSQVSASTSKSLPRSPPEMEANNRIAVMEAKLRDLSRRRGNINTIITELTQVIQPSSIAYDMATRSEVTKTVKSLNSELDDIKKEEHDIGLKLHRAYKKRDEEDFYCEPSGLWIKRVTS